MNSVRPVFIRESRIFMCLFEACFDTNKNCVVRSCQNIISNIKPEIGKDRPVVVVHRHRRNKLALVVPFTTQAPTDEIEKTTHIPAGAMPGVLAKKECWALCDMIEVVSTDRLQEIYSGDWKSNHRRLESKHSVLPQQYYLQIRKTLSGMFA